MNDSFSRHHEYDEAIGHLVAAVAGRRLSGAWLQLAILLDSGGRIEDAISADRKGIELKPDNALAHINLGFHLRKSGQIVEAIAAYRQAIELQADCGKPETILELPSRIWGKLEEAIAANRKAIELKPDMAAAHLNLGNTLGEPARLRKPSPRGGERELAYRYARLAAEGAADRYAYSEALSWLDLAASSARSAEQTQAVDKLTADVLESAGWSEPPRVSAPLPVTREIVSEDLDLRVRG